MTDEELKGEQLKNLTAHVDRADRAAFAAMADGIKWEIEAKRLKAEVDRLRDENRRLVGAVKTASAVALARRLFTPEEVQLVCAAIEWSK